MAVRKTYSPNMIDRYMSSRLNGALAWILLLSGAIVLVAMRPPGLSSQLSTAYVAGLICYFMIGIPFVVVFLWRQTDLFDPFWIVSVLYLLMFSVGPLRDIAVSDYLFFNVDLTRHATKAALLAILGYLAFCFVYVITVNRRNSPRKVERHDSGSYLVEESAGVYLLIWVVAFIVVLVRNLLLGRSVTYVITVGLLGGVDLEQRSDTPLAFLSLAGLMMIPCAVIYLHLASRRLLAVTMQVLTVSALAISGFRYVLVIFLLAHAFVFYIRRDRQPRRSQVAVAAAFAAIFSGLLEFSRRALKSGQDIQWSRFEPTYILDSLFANIQIYQAFYAVLDSVPDRVGFGLGRQMFLYTAIMGVPRALWPDKPAHPIYAPIEAVSHQAVLSGAQYPNLAEYYYEFGIVGAVLLMGLFGGFVGLLVRKIRHATRLSTTVLYAVLSGAVFQLVIRGNTPSNFYMILFLVLPIFVARSIRAREPIF